MTGKDLEGRRLPGRTERNKKFSVRIAGLQAEI
jgi:hypothetical protein